MGFLARITIESPENKPLIIYFHEFGFREVFGEDINSAAIEGGDYMSKILNGNPETFKNSEYLIATLWGNQEAKMADIFGFGFDYKGWPGNPSVSAWVYQNGIYTPTTKITCSESLCVLGKEVEQRRKSKNLEEYLKQRPDLGDLKPRNKVIAFP